MRIRNNSITDRLRKYRLCLTNKAIGTPSHPLLGNKASGSRWNKGTFVTNPVHKSIDSPKTTTSKFFTFGFSVSRCSKTVAGKHPLPVGTVSFIKQQSCSVTADSEPFLHGVKLSCATAKLIPSLQQQRSDRDYISWWTITDRIGFQALFLQIIFLKSLSYRW